MIREILNDEQMTSDNKTARLVEIIDELGLTAPEVKERRYPITPDDVHLIAWHQRGTLEVDPGMAQRPWTQ